MTCPYAARQRHRGHVYRRRDGGRLPASASREERNAFARPSGRRGFPDQFVLGRGKFVSKWHGRRTAPSSSGTAKTRTERSCSSSTGMSGWRSYWVSKTESSGLKRRLTSRAARRRGTAGRQNGYDPGLSQDHLLAVLGQQRHRRGVQGDPADRHALSRDGLPATCSSADKRPTGARILLAPAPVGAQKVDRRRIKRDAPCWWILVSQIGRERSGEDLRRLLGRRSVREGLDLTALAS